MQLKSPMQIVMQIDGGQRHELEAMIKDLEEENKYVKCLQNLIQYSKKCFWYDLFVMYVTLCNCINVQLFKYNW